jgi:hypothetical protein
MSSWHAESRTTALAVAVVIAFALGGSGCSGAAEEPAAPPSVIGPTLSVATSASAAKGPAGPPRRPIEDPPDPEAQKLFRTLLEQPAIPLSKEPPPTVTALALANTARGEARGMTADGAVETALIGEGQRASKKVAIAAGACVTFLAEGGLGVGEVDLFLSSGEGTDLKVLVEDLGGGPIGVIGGHEGCWPNPTKGPLAAELHVVVRRGQGVVVVQGFVR